MEILARHNWGKSAEVGSTRLETSEVSEVKTSQAIFFEPLEERLVHYPMWNRS